MVTRMHQRVAGVTPEGQAFRALDPELMTWVHVTVSWGFLNAYDRYVGPLTLAEKDRYYAEGARLGRAFGAADAPGSVAEVSECFERMAPSLVPHPIIGEFLKIVAETSPLGLAGRMVQPLVVQAAIDLLPAKIRARLSLPGSRLGLGVGRPALRLMARAAAKVPMPEVAQAYERMGRRLPDARSLLL